MSFPLKQAESLLQKGFSRRDLTRMASLLTAGAALPFYNEYAMAQDAQQRTLRGGARRAMDADAVRISSNENPLGPCKEGLEAIAKVAPYGGRYSPFNEQSAFVTAVAEMEGVKESYIAPYAGSSDPLHRRPAPSPRRPVVGRWRVRDTAEARPSSSGRRPLPCRCARTSATTCRQ